MKFTAHTPKGKGIFVKAYVKHGVKYARVSFTNNSFTTNKKGKKVMNRKPMVRDFLYADCTIHKVPSRFSRFLKKLFKRK